jgi:hypothetical protein
LAHTVEENNKSSMTDINRKEIAEQFSCGFCSFLLEESGKLLFVPNQDDFPEIDGAAWVELQELETNFSAY